MTLRMVVRYCWKEGKPEKGKGDTRPFLNEMEILEFKGKLNFILILRCIQKVEQTKY